MEARRAAEGGADGAAEELRAAGADEAEEIRDLLRRLARRVDDFLWAAHKMDVAEFVEYFRHPGRVLWTSFATGVARGLGIAVGFTILGALLLWVLRQSVVMNLPGIGHFIAQLIRIINEDLRVRP